MYGLSNEPLTITLIDPWSAICGLMSKRAG